MGPVPLACKEMKHVCVTGTDVEIQQQLAQQAHFLAGLCWLAA